MANITNTFPLSIPVNGEKSIRLQLMQQIRSSTDLSLAGEAKLDITSAEIWIYDADEEVTGTVDSATSTTVVDTDFNQVDDLWKYLILQFTSGTALKGEGWMVTSFTSDGTFTLATTGIPLSMTPAVGDTFRLPGYAIVGPVAMTITGGVASYDITAASGVTTKPGKKRAKISLTYTTAAGDVERDGCTWDIEIFE